MPSYKINAKNDCIEIMFDGIPRAEIRTKMKSVKYRWNPDLKIWWAKQSDATLAMAKEICESSKSTAPKPQISPCHTSAMPSTQTAVHNAPCKDYALKIKIKDIVTANAAQLATWAKELNTYVRHVRTEDNAQHAVIAISESQESAWTNCFRFIKQHLADLRADMQEFELVFEYSLPGTVHERPDILLLTDTKVISLEFKNKQAPQMDDNIDDVAQAIRYKEWLEHHHEVTKDKNITVKSYLICTHPDAIAGQLRGIDVLAKANFKESILHELVGEQPCSFCDAWLASAKTEMPDMLRAMETMYREGKIPYISEVNKKTLSTVLKRIDDAKKQHKKILILINGVPGAGKTAVGQSIVFEENKGGQANAVYLSGNGPLVEVLQYQINQVGKDKNISENAIQAMKTFKSTYFGREKAPEQYILVFDEAQRAWDAPKMNKEYSEPEGLLRVGEEIFRKHGHVALIGLYGNGQVIHDGEESGISLWEAALKKHSDWNVIVSNRLSAAPNDMAKPNSNKMNGLGKRTIIDNDMYLPVSLRADFVDCSKWVEQVICRTDATLAQAKRELTALQKTAMRIFVTRSFDAVKARKAKNEREHPIWKYGLLISNFARAEKITQQKAGWALGFKRNEKQTIGIGEYGPWFLGECNALKKACPVCGCQGLELDCPIVVFGGDYIRTNNKWTTQGWEFDNQKACYDDPDSIVENNYRVLLTRARKELILFIPNDRALDETYRYFCEMGIDIL